MANTAIVAENIGKRYTLGTGGGDGQLRNVLAENLRGLTRRFRAPLAGTPRRKKEEFWALRDINFTIQQGDRVGIIGRNGAGKSTLLKVLSRITEPTTGRIRVRGRIASLLEVGTGFHPELTGRENIYLNGAILGMARAEIRRKFDEIVDFAEVERFLDTPVKRYSSGMYVRLAFAVAAHLEPEILIVDEVLAVGDAQFQRKCLGKMGEIADHGRTVLFVSHNTVAIQALCRTGIVLNRGGIDTIGTVSAAVHRYHELLQDRTQIAGRDGVEILATTLLPTPSGTELTSDSPLSVELDFQTAIHLPQAYLNVHIEDGDGQLLIHSRTDHVGLRPTFEPGRHRVRVDIDRLGLRGGVYTLWFRLYCNTGDVSEMVDSERIMLEVAGPPIGGVVAAHCEWSLQPVMSDTLTGVASIH